MLTGVYRDVPVVTTASQTQLAKSGTPPGVYGPVCGVIGSIAASEVLKVLAGISTYEKQIVMFDWDSDTAEYSGGTQTNSFEGEDFRELQLGKIPLGPSEDCVCRLKNRQLLVNAYRYVYQADTRFFRNKTPQWADSLRSQKDNFS